MKAVKTSPISDLTSQLRRLSGFAMDGGAATEAARNLAGFFGLLAQIDDENSEQGSEHDCNGSGHCVREAEERSRGIRKRRSR